MKRLIYFILVLGACMPSRSKNHSDNFVITNGNVIDIKNKTIQKRNIYICKGKIVDEQTGIAYSPIPIAAEDKWIIPSLVKPLGPKGPSF